MSSNNASGKVVSVDEQAFEKAGGQAVDEDGFPVVDETPEFEAAVEQETQAKVDANHPDGIADTSTERIHGVTLEQEERIRARSPRASGSRSPSLRRRTPSRSALAPSTANTCCARACGSTS
jgi:ssDNA-binding replication factor A large subunit